MTPKLEKFHIQKMIKMSKARPQTTNRAIKRGNFVVATIGKETSLMKAKDCYLTEDSSGNNIFKPKVQLCFYITNSYMLKGE